MITHNDAPQSAGLLWTNDQSVADVLYLPVLFSNYGTLWTVAWCTALQAGRSQFNSWLCHQNFSLTLSFWLHYGPKVESASIRNEHHEYFLGVRVAGA